MTGPGYDYHQFVGRAAVSQRLEWQHAVSLAPLPIGEHTLHFDAYLSAGPELVMERIAPDAASPEATRWAPGARVSLGERLFFGDRFTVRIAASELVYSGRVRGRSEVERKLTFEGGLAWLFGR